MSSTPHQRVPEKQMQNLPPKVYHLPTRHDSPLDREETQAEESLFDILRLSLALPGPLLAALLHQVHHPREVHLDNLHLLTQPRQHLVVRKVKKRWQFCFSLYIGAQLRSKWFYAPIYSTNHSWLLQRVVKIHYSACERGHIYYCGNLNTTCKEKVGICIFTTTIPTLLRLCQHNQSLLFFVKIANVIVTITSCLSIPSWDSARMRLHLIILGCSSSGWKLMQKKIFYSVMKGKDQLKHILYLKKSCMNWFEVFVRWPVSVPPCNVSIMTTAIVCSWCKATGAGGAGSLWQKLY